MSKRKPTTRAKTDTLTARERLFVLAFTGSCRGNATQSAIRAGYSRKSAHVAGSQIVRKVRVAAALAARMERVLADEVATADVIDRRLTEIVLTGDHHASTRAAAELNRCNGRHSLKVEHSGRLTLEQAITAGRSKP